MRLVDLTEIFPGKPVRCVTRNSKTMKVISARQLLKNNMVALEEGKDTDFDIDSIPRRHFLQKGDVLVVLRGDMSKTGIVGEVGDNLYYAGINIAVIRAAVVGEIKLPPEVIAAIYKNSEISEEEITCNIRNLRNIKKIDVGENTQHDYLQAAATLKKHTESLIRLEQITEEQSNLIYKTLRSGNIFRKQKEGAQEITAILNSTGA